MSEYPTPPATSSPQPHDAKWRYDTPNRHVEAYRPLTADQQTTELKTRAKPVVHQPLDYFDAPYAVAQKDTTQGARHGARESMEYRPSPADQERTDRLMQEYNILRQPVRASEQPAPYDAMAPPQNSYYFPSESKNNHHQQQDAQQPYSQNLNPGLQASIEPRPSQSYSRSPYVQPKTFLMGQQTPPIGAASTSGLSKTSPLRKRSPGNPNYYTDSPLPFASIPVPGRLSPYSLNRPKKRPGFWKRITAKLSSLIRSLRSWTKNNPITAGFLTFLPVLTLAGAVKLGRVLGKGMGLISKTQQGVGGGKEKGKGKGKDKKGREWGYGLDKFVSFNGTKGGPMDGVLKILQMLM